MTMPVSTVTGKNSPLTDIIHVRYWQGVGTSDNPDCLRDPIRYYTLPLAKTLSRGFESML